MTTEAVAQPSTRTAFCPACGADLELDQEQLICKRAACAACGRTIEIVPELFGRPPRGQALVRVGAGVVEGAGQALAVVDPPPSARVREQDDRTIVLRSAWPGVPVWWVALILGLTVTNLFASLVLHQPLLLLLLTAVAAVGLAWPRKTTIWITDDELAVTRGPYGLLLERIPFDRLGAIRVDTSTTTRRATGELVHDTHLSIGRASDYPLALGRRQDLKPISDDSLHWTQRRLTRAIRLARLRRARRRGGA